MCSSKLVKGGADIPTSKPNFEKAEQPPPKPSMSAPSVSPAGGDSDGVDQVLVIRESANSPNSRRDSMEVTELAKFRPSSAKSMVEAADSSRSDIDKNLNSMHLTAALKAAEAKLGDVFDSVLNTNINNEQVAKFEKLTFENTEKIMEAIDVDCSPEEFKEQMSKVAILREACQKERETAIQHYRAEMQGRVATISEATGAWRSECEKTSKTVMDIFVTKVEAMVKAEGLVMDHQFRQHQLMVEAREAEFNQHMTEEHRTLELKVSTVVAKLDLERMTNENANEQKLRADELKKQTETTKLDLEDLKAKKDHDNELRALNRQREKDATEANKQRAKDQDDHQRQLMEVEKQKKQDEREHEKQVKEIKKQKQKDAAEIEKEQTREKAAHEKEKKAQEREAQKEKDKLDKLKNKQKLDESTYEMLVKDLKESKKSYKLEYDLAREAMQNAIAKGRKCTMSQRPPCIDFEAGKVIQGWVKWQLE